MHGYDRVQPRAPPALHVQLLVLERLEVALDCRQAPGAGWTGGGPPGELGAVGPAGGPPVPVIVPPLPVTGAGFEVGAPETPPGVIGSPVLVPLPAEPPAVLPLPVVVPLPGVAPVPVLVAVPDPVLAGPVAALPAPGTGPFIM